MDAGVELVVTEGGDLAAAVASLGRQAPRLWLRSEELDAISLAAAAASLGDWPIGVIVGLDRAPSVLARELSTLSHLCPPGLVVALRPEPGSPGRLGEYVEVLSAMFSGEETTLQVGESRLEAAPNRPLPLPRGGPPIWLDRRTGAGPLPGIAGELNHGDLLEMSA